MTLEDVKSLRTALTLNGKTKILQILCDNGMNCSVISDAVIWDDKNERLIWFGTSSVPYDNAKPINVFCTEYEHIQYLKTNVSLDELDELIKCIESAGTPIQDKDKIKKYFTGLLSVRDLARDPNEKKGYL